VLGLCRATLCSLLQNIITVIWISFSIILFCMRELRDGRPALPHRGRQTVDLSSATTLRTVLTSLATAIPVTPQSMNYASVVFAGFSAIAALWYAVSARKHYKGPVVSLVRAGNGAVVETVEKM
jgi:hypothetical protein